jgi:hypothetical protein
MWYVHLFALGINSCARVSRKYASWPRTKDSGIAPTEALTDVINVWGTRRLSNTFFQWCAQSRWECCNILHFLLVLKCCLKHGSQVQNPTGGLRGKLGTGRTRRSKYTFTFMTHRYDNTAKQITKTIDISLALRRDLQLF